MRHSSNNHLIAADDYVRHQIKKVKVGDRVHIKGYLVDLTAKGEDGKSFSWRSSTTREDSGAHSCELIYATEVEIDEE